jgi:hypothetical protein
MKPNNWSNAILSTGVSVWLGLGLHAKAEESAVDPPRESSRYLWSVQITIRAEAHIYKDGFKDGTPEFITRYTPLREYGGHDYPGYFIDATSLKLDLRDTETHRQVFGLSRDSLGYFNQRNSLFFDPAPFRLELGNSLYRTQQIKPDHRPDPAAGENSIFKQFNDDSLGRDDYSVRRHEYGALLTLRPSAWGHDGTHLGNLDLFYQRSDRDTVRYFDYVTTARMVTGTNANAIRWRGIDQKLIEDVNRGGLGLSFSPFQWIQAYYEISVEKYENILNHDSLAIVPGLPRSQNDPARFRNQPDRDQWQLDEVSLGFIPSTTKLINQIKFDKTVGPGKLNFGYANVFLEQDEFSLFARNRGYEQGQIINHTAFGNWNMPLSGFAIWNAHVHYRLRDNNSTFPALYRTNTAPQGVSQLDFLNPLLDGDAHGGVFPPWIAKIETFRFGTDMTFLLPIAASRILVGWERKDTARDLIFGDPPPGIRRTIDPNEALVRPDSINDAFFLNYYARPSSKVRLRLNNSVTLGDQVGMITEAESGIKSRIGLTYSIPTLLKGATVDVHYQIRYEINDDFNLTSLSLTNTLVSAARQERELLFQSAGLTFTVLPSEKWAAYSGYIWHRDRLQAHFLRTSGRRYENDWLFLPTTDSRYLSDSHTAFIGSSYQFTEKLFGSADYSVNAITGEFGSGLIGETLARDNEMDNITHHLGFGFSYHIKPNWSVGARYAYALYNDAINSRLDSGYHVVGLFASMNF